MRWFGWVLTLAVGCWSLIGCASSLKLSSTVINKNNNKALSGAVVKLVDQNDIVLDSALTDVNGKFVLKLPQAKKSGEYRLIVVKPLLSDELQEVVSFARKPPVNQLIALPLKSGIKGQITDDRDGKVVSAMVTVAVPGSEKDTFLDETETDLEGKFSFGSLDPDEFVLRIRHKDHYPAETEPLALEPGAVYEIKGLKIRYIEGDKTGDIVEALDNEWDIVKVIGKKDVWVK